jgi:flagellar motor switch protein FliN/FliY
MAKKTTEQPTQDSSEAHSNSTETATNVQAQVAEFPEAPAEGQNTGHAGIDLLLDMDVTVTVAIGQTDIPIQRLLQLGPASILKLDKPVSEPVDLFLKDSKFATGTVVVVDDKFAVKIEDILSPNTGSDGRSE